MEIFLQRKLQKGNLDRWPFSSNHIFPVVKRRRTLGERMTRLERIPGIFAAREMHFTARGNGRKTERGIRASFTLQSSENRAGSTQHAPNRGCAAATQQNTRLISERKRARSDVRDAENGECKGLKKKGRQKKTDKRPSRLLHSRSDM